LGLVRVVLARVRHCTGVRDAPLRLWVGVSGGADSVAMLGLLVLLAEGDRLELGVGHVDHRLRPESGREAQHVLDLGARLQVPVSATQLELSPGAGLPARARDARRAALASAARSFGAHAIALGHTATDQAETVLLHLCRGASLPGLAAMGSVDRDAAGVWVRPLLTVTRAEARALCGRLELPFVDDPTNEDPSQPRVAIRTEVLPVLARLRDGVERAIAASADAAREALEAIDAAVQVELARRRDARGHLGLEEIAKIPRAVRTRLVREVCLAGGIDADAVGRRTIADIDRALLDLGPRRSWALRGGHRIVMDDRRLWVESESAQS
jgi:tRNA(Ile)-lysidine synthase